MDPVTRGMGVTFPMSFFDKLGAPIQPVTVTLYVMYRHNGVKVTATPTITQNGNNYTADFDTSVCDPGIITWAVRATGPVMATEGSIVVVANTANPPTVP